MVLFSKKSITFCVFEHVLDQILGVFRKIGNFCVIFLQFFPQAILLEHTFLNQIFETITRGFCQGKQNDTKIE